MYDMQHQVHRTLNIKNEMLGVMRSNYAKNVVNLSRFKSTKWPLTREPTIVFFVWNCNTNRSDAKMWNLEKANRCIFISSRDLYQEKEESMFMKSET